MKTKIISALWIFTSSAAFAATTYQPKGNPQNNCQSETKTAYILLTEDHSGTNSNAVDYSVPNMGNTILDLKQECDNEVLAATTVIDAFQNQKKLICDAITDCSGLKKPIVVPGVPVCYARITLYTDGDDHAVIEDDRTGTVVNNQGSNQQCTYYINPTTMEVEKACTTNATGSSGYVFTYDAELSGETECKVN